MALARRGISFCIRSTLKSHASWSFATRQFSNHKPNYSTTSTPSFDGMKDEYGSLDSSGEIYVADEPFLLESGIEMHQAQVCYTTYGVLNETKDNVLVVCHALTGNAALSSWWGPMLGT